MIQNLYPENSETECIARKTGISDQFCFKREKPRSLQSVLQCLRDSIQRRRPELSITGKWFLLYENVLPQAAIIRQRIFDSTSNHSIAAYGISPNLPPRDFFFIPGTETSIERLSLCWHSDCADGGDKTALQISRKGFPRLLQRPPEMKEIFYWCRRKLFRRRSLAPDWKYAVLFIPSVLELCGRMFK